AHLAIWHGFNAALGLSAVALTGGAALYWWRRPVDRVLSVGSALPTGSDGYHTTVGAVLRTADRVTGVVQSGSMPVYLGVILATAVALPAVALLTSTWWNGWPELYDTWVQ